MTPEKAAIRVAYRKERLKMLEDIEKQSPGATSGLEVVKARYKLAMAETDLAEAIPHVAVDRLV